MLNHFASNLSLILNVIIANMKNSLLIVGALWLINLLNWVCGSFLNRLGILPRTPIGLIGIAFAPILHANAEHLFFNSIPLFLMLSILPVYGIDTMLKLTIFIVVASGLLTWLFGRRAIHIGASSLIMGYWSFLITKAYQAPSMMSAIVAMLTLYYLASMILNLFPQSEKTSWEGHVFGFIAGIAGAYLF